MTEQVTIQAELSEQQAWALAEFLKRVGFSDVRGGPVCLDRDLKLISGALRM